MEKVKLPELTEEKRIELINDILAHERPAPEIQAYIEYGLSMLMNAECLICRSNRIHSGKCYGRIGVIPCLMFAVSDKTIAEWFERKG